jgi:hypothetical protein
VKEPVVAATAISMDRTLTSVGGSIFQDTIFLDAAIQSYQIVKEPGIAAAAISMDRTLTSGKMDCISEQPFGSYYVFFVLGTKDTAGSIDHIVIAA